MANGTYQERQNDPCAPARGCGTAAPVCPTCGGLECLCRPRFFSGQLLTDEDLNRLDHYIVEKHKLHNRYVHGSGVVCGLEVVCDPCGAGVRVRPGYAISPCGEDIVVCAETPADICKLIGECRPRPTDPDCDPPRPAAAEGCEAGTEAWVLAICYDEKPSRGVTALRSASDCPPVSGGSGLPAYAPSTAAGCGCSAQKQVVAPAVTTPRRRPAALCEPTLTCETFRFRVYKAPKTDPRKDESQGEMMRRIQCCVTAYQKALGTFPQQGAEAPVWQQWLADFKAALADLIADSGVYYCQLAARLEKIVCPDGSNVPRAELPQYLEKVGAAFKQMLLIAMEWLRACFCREVLPRCPDPAEQDCIPIARLTVDRRNGCRVVSVCNWKDRRFSLTFPMLWQWLSIFPFFDKIRQAVEWACCTPIVPADVEEVQVGNITAAAAEQKKGMQAVGVKRSLGRKTAFAHLLGGAFAKGRRVGLHTLALGALGAYDAKGEPFADSMEIEHAATFMMLNQVVRPAIEPVLPDAWIRAAAQPRAAPVPDEVATLRETVARLENVVAKHGLDLEKLQRGPNK